MKDYYYILGLSPQATSDEIKTAYRKLSTKFHPDKNGGDTFFEERFKEIHEAYDTLSRPDRRANYDRAYGQRFSQSGTSPNSASTNYTNFYPTIELFTASPSKIYDGDEVEFSWNVFNADSIQIDKIGNVTAKGKKRIKISGLRSAKSIRLTLTATNTHIGKSEKKSVEIFNQAYEDIAQEVLGKKEVHIPQSGQTNSSHQELSSTAAVFIWIVMLAFLSVCFYLITK